MCEQVAIVRSGPMIKIIIILNMTNYGKVAHVSAETQVGPGYLRVACGDSARAFINLTFDEE